MNHILFSIILISSTLFSIKTENIAGLNTSIVVDLKVISGKSSECPSGYVQASGCEDKCDLNYGAGGDYIYLCQKKKIFKDLSVNDKPISKIQVIYNNRDCGDLKLLDSDLNANAGGNDIYLCYGTDEDDRSPITDIFIYIPGLNNVSADYDCDPSNLNDPDKQEQKIYACFKKDKKIPYKIGYSNFTLLRDEQSISEININDEVIYIDNDNYGGSTDHTIIRRISKSVRSIYSFNFNQSLSFLATFDANIPFTIGLDLGISFSLQFDYNENIERTHIQTDIDDTIYKCEAKAGKHVLCKVFNSNYKINIPYIVYIDYYYYDGSIETEKYSSELYGIMGSSIQMRTCCVKGCGYTDKLCPKEEINMNDYESGICPGDYDNKTDNSSNLFVSDIVIITSKTKKKDCPPGYEIVNSGCDEEGCDLNYFGGGDFIYLCQKKEDISLLENETYYINKIQVINNGQMCDDNLTFININLNEDAGGDEIYLCYGNDESLLLNPISDFFIYIEDINYLPENYTCNDVDLNKGTTKGLSTFLCYKRVDNFSLPKIYEANEKIFDEYNYTIVTNLTVVYHPSKVDVSCPPGFERVESKECFRDGVEACDLNYGVGGNFIYLCQKKEKLSKLTNTSSFINEIQIFNSIEEKTDLKIINVDLNRGAGGADLFLAFGYEPDKPLSPIVDFFVYIVDKNTLPDGYDCDKNDLNENTRKKGNKIYICYKRNDEIPREIIINSIELNYDGATKTTLGLPNRLDEILVTGEDGSVTKQREISITESKSLEQSFALYLSLDVSISNFTLWELGFNLSYSFVYGQKWSDETSKTISTEIECHSKAYKTMVCLPYYTNFKMIVPYKAYLSYKNFKNEIFKTTYVTGNYEKSTASQISYKICCKENCCTGKKELDKDKPYCEDEKPDVLCSEIQHCFNNTN